MLSRVLMALAMLAMARSSLPYGDIQSMDDLYRLQRLYEMAQVPDPYLDVLGPVDDIDGRSVDPGQSLWGGEEEEDEEGEASLYNLPLFSGAQARDQEHLEHSALQGLHAVAGGTLEGEPPQKQVKSDKPLPAYCNPPNPCPLGKTAKDNCVENFENSMENNKALLAQQDCPCDTEHMWTCPPGQKTVTSKGSGGQAALNKVMSELAELHSESQLSLENNPYLTSGIKRDKLVAKKSPGLARHKRSQEQEEEWNPYFEGKQLEVAAKKSPEMVNIPAKP